MLFDDNKNDQRYTSYLDFFDRFLTQMLDTKYVVLNICKIDSNFFL